MTKPLLLALLVLVSCGQKERFSQVTVDEAELRAELKKLESVGLRYTAHPSPSFDSAYDRQFEIEHVFLTRSERIEALNSFLDYATRSQTKFGQMGNLVHPVAVSEARIKWEKELQKNPPPSDFRESLEKLKELRTRVVAEGALVRVNIGSGRVTIDESTKSRGAAFSKAIGSYLAFSIPLLKGCTSEFSTSRLEQEAILLRGLLANLQ